jgi:serine/threonine protein kinase
MKNTSGNSKRHGQGAANDQLIQLYDTSLEDLHDEEKEALLPILNSLNKKNERYEELKLIAKGGEKRILRVYDRYLNRQVAMARSINAKTKREQEQFLREARVEANLTHPFIVPVYDMGIDENQDAFFTMELITGDTLRKIITRLRKNDPDYLKNYPLSTLLEMYLKVCDAIAYAHSRNVLHLDIKPENIHTADFGKIFICDWGLAKILFEKDSERATGLGELDGDLLNDTVLCGTITGTAGFMAPEQADPNGNKTVQTDIYALGALLYNLLTYECPVKGKSRKEILDNTRTGRVIRPSTLNKNIPKSLTCVAMKALSLRPKNRYDNVRELSEEIRRYLSGLPTRAEQAGLTTRFTLLVKRHNRLASLMLFFALMLSALTGLHIVRINETKEEAIHEREVARKNLELFQDQLTRTSKLDNQINLFAKILTKSEDHLRVWNMIKLTNYTLSRIKNPELKKELMIKLGTLYFTIQHFKTANEYFQKAPPETYINKDAWYLSNKYAEIKPNDKEDLTLRQMACLFRNASPDNHLIYYMYLLYAKKTKNVDPEEYLPVAHAMLDALNRTNTQAEPAIRLEKRNEGYHLDLSNAPYTTLSIGNIGRPRAFYSILRMFKIHSLDISYLPIITLRQLRPVPVQELRMVGVYIQNEDSIVADIKRMGVKKLHIDISAYSPEVITELQKTCEVIDEKEAPPPRDKRNSPATITGRPYLSLEQSIE